jgi:hypothetical protein
MFKKPACFIIVSILLTSTLLAVTAFGCHPVSTLQNQEHIPPTQIKTETIPLGYFELTVSPVEVYANVGEQIEICCTIDTPLVNTPIEISSVDVVLFDSYDSIIREQAMTMWDPQDGYHYLSASTAYTIVGDEAYYKLEINFTFPLGESGEYTEYTAHSFPIVVSQEQEPIEIVSVLGPIGLPNPAGPIVEITLKNVSVEPVVSLTATLKVFSALGKPFDFTFNDVAPANPLQPNGSTSDTRCLIGGGFAGNVLYPLTINATIQDGANFVYTKLVQIVGPPLVLTWGGQ